MRDMPKCVLGLFVGLAGLGLLVSSAEAQFKNGSQPTELNIPRVSQRASVTQRIGLTDITIIYYGQGKLDNHLFQERDVVGELQL